MTPAIALLVIGGILLKAGWKNQNILDVALGRDTKRSGGNVSDNTVVTDPQAGTGAGSLVGTGAGSQAMIDRAAHQAERMGLHVGENPRYGGVHPVHAKGSLHYSGRAIDVSGNTTAMQRFAAWADRTLGGRINELFWNGPGAVNRDQGKRVQPGYVEGHTDHVHLGF